ncbi:MAG: rRNA maturation RNase YbeY [Puniceicoccales bacterium]|jgi:probable rRNA maturation factor|nr:rRNA maturation RNase YbeY [Puniceicoccales bacterium]
MQNNPLPHRRRKVHVSILTPNFHAPTASVSNLFALLDKHPSARIPSGELSVAFLDDAEICRVHAQFLNDPSPTDVITFPSPNDDSPDGESLAGEICVCVPYAHREAAKHGNTPATELLLYLVHGWLHLAGYDDIHDADRDAMRKAEQETLSYLEKTGFSPQWSFPHSPPK